MQFHLVTSWWNTAARATNPSSWENIMQPPRRQFLRAVAGTAALAASPRIVWSQAFPTRPVRMIVPYAPGGQTDILARLIAQKLSEQFGKQFYVENILGASGNIGTGQAARAAPDGYTILIAFTTFAINPAFFEKAPYDPAKDFDAVTLAAASTTVLLINASLPVKSVDELVNLVRANPGKYSFASPGVGTPPHLLGEQFRVSLGLDLVHVPFNGLGPRRLPSSPATRQLPSADWPRPSSTSGTAGCACSRCWARPDREFYLMCQP
jgi:tripartite-type tricarboxylate transporter receptor subunit TctC